MRFGIELLDFPDGASALTGAPHDGLSGFIAPTDLTDMDPVAFTKLVQRWCHLPLFITVGADETAQVRAAEAVAHGAHGPLHPPMDASDLARRLRAACLPEKPSHQQLRCGRLQLDADRFRASIDGETILLTVRQFQTLWCLMERAGRTVTVEDLAEISGQELTVNAAQALIARIRHQIAAHDPQLATMIHTVRTRGYCLEPPR